MKRFAYIFFVLGPVLFAGKPVNAGGGGKSGETSLLKAAPDTILVSYRITRVSDFDFRNHQYVVDMLLNLEDNHPGRFDFRNELEICHAKDLRMRIIDSFVEGSREGTLLKVRATIFHDFDVTGYPFDGQHLKLKIYDEVHDARHLVFKLLKPVNLPGMMDSVLEDGWKMHSLDSAIALDSGISCDEEHQFSSLNVMMDIHRELAAGLFLKIFIGMYVAFLVAFAALFIDVREVEPRFGLPVGALFGAIANKYIVESLLPQSPQFNIADWLHSITFVFILLVIVSSILALRLKTGKLRLSRPAMKMALRFERVMPMWILGAYVALNTTCIVWIFLHEIMADRAG